MQSTAPAAAQRQRPPSGDELALELCRQVESVVAETALPLASLRPSHRRASSQASLDSHSREDTDEEATTRHAARLGRHNSRAKNSSDQLREIYDGVSVPSHRRSSKTSALEDIPSASQQSLQHQLRLSDLQQDVAKEMDELKGPEDESTRTPVSRSASMASTAADQSKDGQGDTRKPRGFRFKLPKLAAFEALTKPTQSVFVPPQTPTQSMDKSPDGSESPAIEVFFSKLMNRRDFFEKNQQQKADRATESVEDTADPSHEALPLGPSEPQPGPPDMHVQWGDLLLRENMLVAGWSATTARTLRHCVRKGVPASLRGQVWMLLCRLPVLTPRPVQVKTKGETPKGMATAGTYKTLLPQTSPYEAEIRRDIVRTFPSHPLFAEKGGSGQEALFNVMKAYSLYDPALGYCQGLGFIVGVLLMHLTEEDAFLMLTHLLHGLDLRPLFLPVMEPLLVSLYQLARLLLDREPQMHAHLMGHGVRVSMYASQWLLTLFSSQFPLPLVCRILDHLLVEGPTFLLRMALAMLQTHRSDVMGRSDFEEILGYLKYGLPRAHGLPVNNNLPEAAPIAMNLQRQAESIVAKMDQLADISKGQHLRRASTNGSSEHSQSPAATDRQQDCTEDASNNESVAKLVDAALQIRLGAGTLELLASEYSFMKERADWDDRERTLRWQLQEARERADTLQRDSDDMKKELLVAYEGFNAVQKETAESWAHRHMAMTQEVRQEYQQQIDDLQVLVANERSAVEELESSHVQEIERMEAEHRATVEAIGAECKTIVDRVGAQCKQLIEESVREHSAQLQAQQDAMEEREQMLQAEKVAQQTRHQRELEELRVHLAQTMAQAAAQADAAHDAEVAQLHEQIGDLRMALQQVIEDTDKERRADADQHQRELEALQQVVKMMEAERDTALQTLTKLTQTREGADQKEGKAKSAKGFFGIFRTPSATSQGGRNSPKDSKGRSTSFDQTTKR